MESKHMSDPMDRPRRRVAHSATLAAMAAGLIGSVWWSGTLSAPEKLLARSYRAAIADAGSDTRGIRLTPAALTDTAEPTPVEALWPGNPAARNSALHRPLKIGDHITISSREGKADKLSIVALQQIDGAGIGAPGVRFQLVTSRQDGLPDGPVVRLLIVDGGAAATAGDKTL